MTWQRKGQIFEKSYDEVLIALKHQDDKLNRTLTAIAFLTAAGVAIYAIVASGQAVKFDGSDLDAVAVFFIIFLASVLLALLVALSAIGPSDALPPRTSSPLQKWPSLLYWAHIVKQDEWEKRIDDDLATLEESLARNLHEEAKVLANRVNYKVARSRESGAFVQVAVLSLVLLGVFSAKSLSIDARWWIASVILVLVLALPLWDFAQMRRYNFPGAQAAGVGYALVGFAASWTAALLFSADGLNSHWWAAFYAMAAILATRLAYVNRTMARVLLPTAALAGPIVALVAWTS